MKEREENTWLTKTVSSAFATPFLLTDLSVIDAKVQQFKELLPRVEIYYAVKSNNDPKIIKRLNKSVQGYDIASVGELRQLMDLGVDPARVFYSNPVKVPDHIKEARKKGVEYFAFDSVSEIQKLAEYAPNSSVHLRIRVSDYGSKFPLSGKFGVDPVHAVAYAATAQEAGLKVKGLAFHVGSQSENPRVWSAALKIAGDLIEKLAHVGINIEFLNIGGGFPAIYEDLAPTIENAAPVINKALDKYIPKDIKIVAEPGRYISANASIMGTTVIGREYRGGAEWLYLDMGVFQGLIEALEINLKFPVFTDRNIPGDEKSFVLSGPTCDAYDTIGLDYSLPSGIKIGDRIYIGATGAYSMVYGSEFNGFELPKKYYAKDKVKD